MCNSIVDLGGSGYQICMQVCYMCTSVTWLLVGTFCKLGSNWLELLWLQLLIFLHFHPSLLLLLLLLFFYQNLPFLPSYNPSRSSLSPFLPHLSHLQDFVTKYSETNLQFSDSNVNFVRHQILEYAREILEKSRENKLTKEQFILLSENLEQGIVEVRTRLI